MNVKYGVVIRAAFKRKNSIVPPSYVVKSFSKCPLGNKSCRYNISHPTFCTRISGKNGFTAACICGATLPRPNDIAEFGDVIENFAGNGITHAIIQKLESARDCR